MSAKQSRQDQERRIENFTCPIHGVVFTQQAFLSGEVGFSVAGCSRRDCHVSAIVDCRRTDRESELTIRQLVTSKQLMTLERIWLEMFQRFRQEANKRLEEELEVMASDPEVQLPVR